MNRQPLHIYFFRTLLFVIFFLPIFSQAQLGTPVKASPSTTVGKVTPMGTFVAELSYTQNPTDEKDTTYTLRFHDYKYKQNKETFKVDFSGIDHTVDSLYALMKTVFTEENRKNKDYAVTVTLGKDLISISNYHSFGTVGLMFLIPNGSYGVLTEGQLDKLFGKNQ